MVSFESVLSVLTDIRNVEDRKSKNIFKCITQALQGCLNLPDNFDYPTTLCDSQATAPSSTPFKASKFPMHPHPLTQHRTTFLPLTP